MAFDSFGEFVRALDRQGELLRISTPVATELEITALADRQMKSPGGGIPPYELDSVLGMVTTKALHEDDFLSHDVLAKKGSAQLTRS